jgi:putative intracellular protease/amidase
MASDTLKGLKVAILVTDGFEKVELTQPRKALDEAGAVTGIVSPRSSKVRSWFVGGIQPACRYFPDVGTLRMTIMAKQAHS